MWCHPPRFANEGMTMTTLPPRITAGKIVITRMVYDPTTRDYIDRRIKERLQQQSPASKRETLRSVRVGEASRPCAG